MGRTACSRKGSKKVYAGDELTCIGMPVGGICAGQLYLRGDGTLAEWGIFNVDRFTGYGDNCYRTYTPPSPVEQGFGLAITPDGGRTVYRTLDRHGFPRIEFVGRVSDRHGPLSHRRGGRGCRSRLCSRRSVRLCRSMRGSRPLRERFCVIA